MGDCLRPLACWPALNGGRPSFVQPRVGEGFSHHPQLVRCRECPPCRAHHALQIALRCVCEHVANGAPGTFATLTYAPDFIYAPLGAPSVSPQHVTRWLKRLRKRYGKVRYFVAAEYGDKGGRPHYHALLFGRVFTSAQLELTWKFGSVHVDELVTPTILYTAQYVEKKLYGALADEHYRGVFPPFHRASQGLGRDYLTKYLSNVALDSVWVPTPDGGYRMPLPDSLLQYLEKVSPLLHEALSDSRKRAAQAALSGDKYLLHQRRVAAAVIAAKKAAQRSSEFS